MSGLDLRLQLMQPKARKRKMLEMIREAIRCAKFGKNASFETLDHSKHKYPTNEKEADAFIKERIKLYSDTWIVDPLYEIAQQLERELDNR